MSSAVITPHELWSSTAGALDYHYSPSEQSTDSTSSFPTPSSFVPASSFSTLPSRTSSPSYTKSPSPAPLDIPRLTPSRAEHDCPSNVHIFGDAVSLATSPNIIDINKPLATPTTGTRSPCANKAQGSSRETTANKIVTSDGDRPRSSHEYRSKSPMLASLPMPLPPPLRKAKYSLRHASNISTKSSGITCPHCFLKISKRADISRHINHSCKMVVRYTRDVFRCEYCKGKHSRRDSLRRHYEHCKTVRHAVEKLGDLQETPLWILFDLGLIDFKVGVRHPRNQEGKEEPKDNAIKSSASS